MQALTAGAPADADGEADPLEMSMARMSGEEFRARLLSALAAERYAAEQKRFLANVRVGDDALPTELKSAIKAALESPASSLDEVTLRRVVRFLGGTRTADDEFMLVRNKDAHRAVTADRRPAVDLVEIPAAALRSTSY